MEDVMDYKTISVTGITADTRPQTSKNALDNSI